MGCLPLSSHTGDVSFIYVPPPLIPPWFYGHVNRFVFILDAVISTIAFADSHSTISDARVPYSPSLSPSRNPKPPLPTPASLFSGAFSNRLRGRFFAGGAETCLPSRSLFSAGEPLLHACPHSAPLLCVHDKKKL